MPNEENIELVDTNNEGADDTRQFLEGIDEELSTELGKPKEKEGKKEEESEEEEGKEKKEKEVEIEEEKVPTEEELILAETLSRKKILTKYPNLFKDFPGINRAIYREQAYTEVFPTVEDAKDAEARSKEFGKFEEALVSGDVKGILDGVKAQDEEGLTKIAFNFLPSLAKVDNATYSKVVESVYRTAINTMYTQGQRRNNKNFQMAAVVMNDFLFGSTELQPVENQENNPASKKTKENDSELKHKEAEYNRQHGDVTTKIQNILSSTVDRYLDPNDLMTSFVKKHAIKATLEDVDEALSSDTRFQATIERLWKSAVEDDFSTNSINKIKNTYLSAAKSLLGPSIKRVRAEALKNQSAKSKEESAPLVNNRPSGGSTKDTSKKLEVPKGMSTREFLDT